MCLQLASGPFPAGHPHLALTMSLDTAPKCQHSLYMQSFWYTLGLDGQMLISTHFNVLNVSTSKEI